MANFKSIFATDYTAFPPSPKLHCSTRARGSPRESW